MFINRKFINRRFFGLNITGGSGMGSATSTDNFTRTANPISNPMSDGVSTWQTTALSVFPVLQTNGTQAIGTSSSTLNASQVVSPTFTGNHKATVKIATLYGAVGPLVRVQGASDNRCYWFQLFQDGTGTSLYLSRYTTAGATTSSQIGLVITASGGTGTGGSVAIGDTISLAASGTTLTCYVNSTVVRTVTDTNLSGGQPGLLIFDTGVPVTSFSATDIP